MMKIRNLVLVLMIFVLSSIVVSAQENNGIVYTSNTAENIAISNYTSQDSMPKFKGYIVEFKEKSLIEQNIENIGKNETNKDNKEKNEKYHENAISDIKSKIKDKKKVKIIDEYNSVFNGVALDIDAEEVEKIKESEYVLDVYPNYEIRAELMDSVPLIGANKLWEAKNFYLDAVVKTSVDAAMASDEYLIYEKGGYDGIVIPHESTCKIINEIPVRAQDWGREIPGTDGMTNYWNVECYFFSDLVDYGEDGWGRDAVRESGWLPESVLEAISPEKSITGKNIKIAILDTGVDYTHRDLGGCFGENCKVISGYDFVNGDTDPIDDNGHGTHVASIAAGNGILKGVAPDAKIVSYKVLDSNGIGYWNNIISGIERAVDPNGNGDFSDHVDIISISIGGQGNPDDAISRAVDRAVDAGVVVVVAAGNSYNEQTISSPGTARKAITVGAIDKSENVASFSSKGPVIWNANDKYYLSKPDVVAPGVDICAAQLKDSWSDRECLDGEHISLSGTSMATPHVAGVAALIKQAHPYWSVEEIKYAIRNTAKDLGYLINHQGYGEIDAYAAVSSKNAPTIAYIEPIIDAKGKKKISLYGTAKSNNGIEKYELTYSYPNGQDIVCIGTKPVDNDVLCEDFDISYFNDKLYILDLKVYDKSGKVSKDRTGFFVKNSEIKSVGKNLNYVSGIEEIKGSIFIEGYDSYSVEYRREDSSQWSIFCTANQLESDVLCTGDASSFNNGIYYFRTAIKLEGNTIHGEQFKSVAVKELISGWPMEVFGTPYSHPIIGEYNGKKQLAFTSMCEDIICSNLYFHFISSDNEARKYSSFNKFGESVNIPFDFKPTLYNSPDRNYLAFSYSSSPGIVTFDGNYENIWENMQWVDGMVVDKNKIIYGLSFEQKNVKLSAINKIGDKISGFPVIVSPESGNEALYSNEPRVFYHLDKNTGKLNKKIAILAGNYDLNSNYDMENLNFFLDTYSSNSVFEKRTKLFEGDAMLRLPTMITGDINNDGSQEIIVSFGILDVKKFRNDNYDVSAYITYYYILDSSGSILAGPVKIFGYLPSVYSNLVIGNVAGQGLSVISMLGDTWPTTYNGHKIIVFDSNLVAKNQFNLPNYNYISNGIVLADTNADGKSEIISNYRPRFYDGKSSGLYIFDNSGRVIKNIEIPTMGAADDYYGFAPILTDFNKDGKLDWVQESLYLKENDKLTSSRIYAVDLEVPFESSKLDWPSLMHDFEYSGSFDSEKFSLEYSRANSALLKNTKSSKKFNRYFTYS